MTDEKTLKKKLVKQKKSLALFDIILQNLDDGVSVQNKLGEFIYENEQAQLMHKIYFNAKAKYTNTVGDYVSLQDLPPYQSLKDGETHKLVIEIANPAKYHNVWMRIKAVPVFDKRKKLAYVVATWRDITGRILEEKRRDHFIAIGSHELRTPLAGIKVLNQAMQKLYAGHKFDQAESYFTKIDSKVNILTRLIQDFIEVEKIRAGKLDFYPRSFDLVEMIKNSVNDLRQIYPLHPIIVRGKIDKKIIADEVRIQQVINNLIVNACKYTPDNTQILITLKKADKIVTVEVKDMGIGIDEQYISKIFQPFYRVRNPESVNAKGLGLGLYISYKIIELHGGKMWVKSKLGVGSTFHFTLPLVIKKSKQVYEF